MNPPISDDVLESQPLIPTATDTRKPWEPPVLDALALAETYNSLGGGSDGNSAGS